MAPTGTTALALALWGADWRPPMLTAGLYLAVVLLTAAVILALLQRWRRRSADDRLSPADQLAQFRSLYEQGLLSQEEFERLRNLLGGEIRRGTGGARRRPQGRPSRPAERHHAASLERRASPSGRGRRHRHPAGVARRKSLRDLRPPRRIRNETAERRATSFYEATPSTDPAPPTARPHPP